MKPRRSVWPRAGRGRGALGGLGQDRLRLRRCRLLARPAWPARLRLFGRDLLGFPGTGLPQSLGKVARVRDLLQRGQHRAARRRSWRPARRRAWPAGCAGALAAGAAAPAAGGGQLLLQSHGAAQGLGRRRDTAGLQLLEPRRLQPLPPRAAERRPRRRAGAAVAAPPARAAASFSFERQRTAQGRRAGRAGRGAAGRGSGSRGRAGFSVRGRFVRRLGCSDGRARPRAFAAPALAAASRISCTLGRFAIALVPASV